MLHNLTPCTSKKNGITEMKNHTLVKMAGTALHIKVYNISYHIYTKNVINVTPKEAYNDMEWN